MNQARKHTEKIIDCLYEQVKSQLDKKPRAYRQIARKNYLKVAKKRRISKQERTKAIKKQLQYIKRNISHLKQLVNMGAILSELSNRQYKILLVISEVYRQQLWLHENNKKTIEDRIVSLNQPHIRPIVRGHEFRLEKMGQAYNNTNSFERPTNQLTKPAPFFKEYVRKAGKPVEFGAKLSASYFDGYVFLDHISWNNFNESGDLKTQIESFKNYTGYYPESVHVDKIYRTRENARLV